MPLSTAPLNIDQGWTMLLQLLTDLSEILLSTYGGIAIVRLFLDDRANQLETQERVELWEGFKKYTFGNHPTDENAKSFNSRENSGKEL
ncbi:hypothetical protein M407DRAFT_245682 [Tulasnella calospora MUT 4182]|uniref:Uncharacterized protein n=1 Tax=Tulasnella calospora MUT 4182 TaxID=1051891 RepID=A0A0C3Q8T1_9AGAM|nr:hypothetical protein M407DRAFT_245682 [Tulasnella calospora MUT 4182]